MQSMVANGLDARLFFQASGNLVGQLAKSKNDLVGAIPGASGLERRMQSMVANGLETGQFIQGRPEFAD